MPNTTAQAFNIFLSEIEASDYQKQTIIPAREQYVIDTLQETFPATSNMPFMRTHLIGSASKGTVIRPIEDVDVLAVFSDQNNLFENEYHSNSQDFLYRIREACDGVSTQDVGARGQAVRVFFEAGGYVDIAPVFFSSQDSNNFFIPSGNGSWITTSPLRANEWFETRHRELSYNLKPVVRLLKKWNREHSSHFNSFHLETLIATLFTSIGLNYRDALLKFFQSSPYNLSVSDPGGHSGDLSNYLTINERTGLIDAINSAKDRAERAVDAEYNGDHEEAKRLWSIILGDDFPRS